MTKYFDVEHKRIYKTIEDAQTHIEQIMRKLPGSAIRPVLRWYARLESHNKPLPVLLDLTRDEVELIPRIGVRKADIIMSAILKGKSNARD